ncbi:MAG: acetyl/propionyl/methylcrotonyl-CoA carboxylase subunit alpha [Mycobacteriales bacterium]|nr:acetyl/propionyl/methylcrotonyl-CoA carboxylase subunit alpha [Mycobacteriales bacterium]
MFETVLVANRGEIACRVIKTLRAMGIRSVAVYSDADAEARHVREADVAVRLGPAAARESYLSIEKVVQACLDTGAQAVHPGYGFLAENADFARALEAAGIVFIGPPVHAVEVMGDKISAKQTVSAAGVPVVPGRSVPGMTDDDLYAAALEVGFPVLLKPSAGGGGKGMHLVEAEPELRAAIERARREAASSFGDDTLFLERFVDTPRHIEVQVLADGHGNVVHLGERECSLQRRHQKVVEEAPSALLDAATRARIGASAVETARSVGYTGAGTVEFIVPAASPDEFFFMEMNTRLQVEHPVTELVTGIDLVEQQVRVAAGEPLPFTQDDITLTGHAVEVRVYAEDPARGFLPTGGRALLVREPGDVRVDSSLVEGGVVGTTYDPMLSKVIAYGRDRAEALARLDGALSRTAVLGVGTNTAFLRALLAHPDVVAGRLDTGLIDREVAGLVDVPVPAEALAAFAMDRLARLTPTGALVDPWDLPTSWRPSGPAEMAWDLVVAGARHTVAVRGSARAAAVRVDGGEPVAVRAAVRGRELALTVDGVTTTFLVAHEGDVVHLGRGGAAWALSEAQRVGKAGASASHSGDVLSPMPGSVVAVHVTEGEAVTAGQSLLVVEAMKMEHTLTAPFDGTVTELRARTGDQVKVDQLLAIVEPVTP